MSRWPFSLLGALLLNSAAHAAPPEAASARCNFSDGSLDFSFDYEASERTLVMDRGGMIFTYNITARVPYEESIIVVGQLPPPSVLTAVFVIGAENRAHFYREGRLVDEKMCELVEGQVQ